MEFLFDEMHFGFAGAVFILFIDNHTDLSFR